MSEFNEIAGCEADRDPDAYTDDRLLGRIRARFARAAALHSEFEKAQAEHDSFLAAAQWDAGIAQTETVSAVLGNGPTLKLVKPPDSWRVLVAGGPGSPAATGARDGLDGLVDAAELQAAGWAEDYLTGNWHDVPKKPLPAPWHHLPCVTAGAAPPAPAEEPIWRALRAKGDGVVR